MNEDDVRGPVVVFLGPTLPLSEAEAELPDALYLPPARCGDVLQSLRLSPRALLIIDGTFERTPAVWHKEIGLALERGVPVFGAASMGALRAAEMEAFGMIGVGSIFRDYREGRLIDDDEVAVIHDSTGRPLSEAMVDIRATVERAVDRGLLRADSAAQIVTTAKKMFYPERSLRAVMAELGEPRELEYVGRKRSDALEALRTIAHHRRTGFPKPPPLRVPRTMTVRLLVRHVACSTFHGEHAALPKMERVLRAARFLGDPYRDAKHLAQLLATLGEIARERPSEASSVASDWWPAEMDTSSWAAANDCRPSEQLALRERVAQIGRLEQHAIRPPEAAHERLAWRSTTNESRYLRWLDAMDPSQQRPPTPSRVRRLTARAWRTLDALAREARLVPSVEPLQGVFNSIRIELGLGHPADVERWLAAHELDRCELSAMLVARSRWEMIATHAQLAVFGVERLDETGYALLDAMRVSGLYPVARDFLAMDVRQREELAVFPRSLMEAIDRDLETDDHDVLQRELRRQL